MVSKLLTLLAGIVSLVTASHDVHGGITGVSWGAQRLDVFGVDTSNNVFHKYYTAFGWGPDDPKHGSLELFTKAKAASPVTVTSWASNRLDFVFVDVHGNAQHKYWDGGSWGPNDEDGFDLLGKGVSGKLALNSWGPNRFDVVGLSADQTYVHKAWTGSEYHPGGQRWESLGGEFASTPAIVSSGTGRLDVFGITNEGNITHKYWDGYQWQPSLEGWEDLGGKGFGGVPVASSPYAGRFDIWAVSKKTGELYHLFWDGFQYRGWESLGGNFKNAPQVVHWSQTRTDLLGLDAEHGTYLHKYWDGFQWSNWTSKGGHFDSEPALVSISENNLNLFGVDKDGDLKLQVWDGSQWLPDNKSWYKLGNIDVGGDDDENDKTAVVNFKPGTGETVMDEAERNIKIELRFRA